MSPMLIVLLAGLILGIVLSWLKLYLGYGLIAASCAGYLCVYYITTELAAIFNKYAAEAGVEQVDVSSNRPLMYMAWGGLGLSLLALLANGSSKE